MSTTYLAILEELAKRTGLGRLGIATAAGTAATIVDSQRMLGLVQPAISIGAPVLVTTANPLFSGTANAAVTTTTGPPGTLTDTRVAWTVNVWAGTLVTCGTKTMTVTSNTATVLTGTGGWSGGGNPGDGLAYSGTSQCSGQHTYVQAEPPKTTGILSIAPSLTVGPTVGDTFQVWNSDFGHVDRVKECVNRALTQWCARYVLEPVTILLDGDMEKVAYADWTAGTSASLAKTPMAEGAPTRQVLSVTNTTLQGYAYQSIPVQVNETFTLIVCCRGQATADTAEVSLYATPVSASGPTLTGDGGTAQPGITWQVLRKTFTIPTGATSSVHLQLGVHLTTQDAYYAWVALTRQNAREVVLPDRVNRPNRIGRIYRAHRTASSPYEAPGSWRLEEVTGVKKVATRGTGGVVLHFPEMLGDHLYLYEEYQPYTALSALTDTTECPLEWLVAASAYECFDLLFNQWREGDASRAPMPGQMDPNPYAASRQRWMSRMLAERVLALGPPQTVLRTA